MSYPDLVAFPMAQALVACLEDQMSLVLDPPASVGLRPGQQVDPLLSIYEDECCNGLAWVRINRIYPSSIDDFPTQDQVAIGCPSPRAWAVEMEMGAVRCAPTPDATTIPSNDDWGALVEKQMQDAAAMRRAVICCFGDLDITYLLGDWNPLPVSGRCSGGTQMVTVAAEYVDCCEDVPESPGESPGESPSP
jgi:hypothetical protein